MSRYFVTQNVHFRASINYVLCMANSCYPVSHGLSMSQKSACKSAVCKSASLQSVSLQVCKSAVCKCRTPLGDVQVHVRLCTATGKLILNINHRKPPINVQLMSFYQYTRENLRLQTYQQRYQRTPVVQKSPTNQQE